MDTTAAETDAAKDVEIYIKSCSKQKLLNWLQGFFEVVTEQACKGNKTTLNLIQQNGQQFEAMLIEHAAGKNFTCFWLQSDQGPWQNDRDCAKSAFDALGCEVRCNAQGWAPNQDPDLWWQINAEGEGEVIWRG